MNKLCSAAVVVATLVAGPAAHAALGGGPTGVTIPYAGHLDRDGAAVTGAVDFEFDVRTNATTPCAAASGANAMRVLGVVVTGGQFALELTNVPEVCVKGTDVHLAIAVRSPAGGNGAFTPIGVQRVVPVLAATTSGAGDFHITGVATASAMTATGTVQGATVRATTEVQAPKTVITGSNNVVSNDLAVVRTADGTRALSIRAQSIEATGAVTDQDLTLASKGNGALRAGGKVAIFGAVTEATFDCANPQFCNGFSQTATTDGFLVTNYTVTVVSNNTREINPAQWCDVRSSSSSIFAQDIGIGGTMTVPVRKGESMSVSAAPRQNLNRCLVAVRFMPLGVP